MNHTARRLLLGGAVSVGLASAAAASCVGLVTGRVSLDLGVGRRTRALGPITIDITAPREIVYSVATAPYAERRPRAMQEKVEILARGHGMVLAAHHTPVGGRLTAVTVETVTFTPPERIDFRLVRGPVPYVTETFLLAETPSGTRLTYTGELGTDLGRAGELWGDLVARSWVGAVEASLDAIRTESERQAR